MVLILLGIASLVILPGYIYYFKTGKSWAFWLSGWGMGLYCLAKPMTEVWKVDFATNEDNTMRKLSLMVGAVVIILMLVASLVSLSHKKES